MSRRRIARRSVLYIGWCACLGLTIFLAAFPINVGLIRLFLVTAVPALAVGACVLLWSRKRLRLLPGVLLVVPIGILVAPGRRHDAQSLRRRYITALRRYEGTRYVWGGENGFGIDCSGFVRRGLIDANLREGVATLNPGRLRAESQARRAGDPRAAAGGCDDLLRGDLSGRGSG